MKEVFISFAVFVFCVSLTIFSQFNSPQVVNAVESEIQSVQKTPVAKSSNVSNNNLLQQKFHQICHLNTDKNIVLKF